MQRRSSLGALARAASLSLAASFAGCATASSQATPAGSLAATQSIQRSSIPTEPPLPSPRPFNPDPVLFTNAGSGAIHEYDAITGAQMNAFGSAAGQSLVAVDGAGEVFEVAPASSSSYAARFAIGATAPAATYATTGQDPEGIAVTPGGVLAIASASLGSGTYGIDVWDRGEAGDPSRTLSSFGPIFALTPDGTIYNADSFTTPYPQIEVVPPRSTTVARVVPITLFPDPSQAFISALAVGQDGTIYAADFSGFGVPDNGLYVVPVHGRPFAVHAIPDGIRTIATDAEGNVFVTSNTRVSPFSVDSSHTLSVYAQDGSVLLRRVTVQQPTQVIAAGLGSAYVLCDACVAGAGGIAYLASGATKMMPLVSGLEPYTAGLNFARYVPPLLGDAEPQTSYGFSTAGYAGASGADLRHAAMLR